VERMAISEFKAKCLAVLERVRKTRKPILVTRFGEPVAEVGPPTPPEARGSWLGSMAGTATIRGDVVGPISNDKDWEALR
jgi:prevent-host-death family protein